jgi:hypothetical protein
LIWEEDRSALAVGTSILLPLNLVTVPKKKRYIIQIKFWGRIIDPSKSLAKLVERHKANQILGKHPLVETSFFSRITQFNIVVHNTHTYSLIFTRT